MDKRPLAKIEREILAVTLPECQTEVVAGLGAFGQSRLKYVGVLQARHIEVLTGLLPDFFRLDFSHSIFPEPSAKQRIEVNGGPRLDDQLMLSQHSFNFFCKRVRASVERETLPAHSGDSFALSLFSGSEQPAVGFADRAVDCLRRTLPIFVSLSALQLVKVQVAKINIL